ncbi:DNA-directed DNA polymerase II small subunit [Candidatus Bathyarchaeota archaeon]|nr:DNA-directed DNA polymerase II small subunit [Candidatus Bathyarchaeota archaeon]
MTEAILQELQRVLAQGYQLSPDVFTFLQNQSVEEAAHLVDEALKRASTKPDLYLLDLDFFQPTQTVVAPKLKPYAATVKSALEIHYPEETRSIGSSDGYIDYFNSRLIQLEAIIKHRVDVRDAIPLSQAVKLPLNTKFKTVGIVSSKSARNNKLFLDIEDKDTQATVLVSGEDAVKKGLEILEDQVICIDGVRYREDLIIANDLIWPDVPMHEVRRSEENISAVFVGDVHVGSKYFRGDLFDKFIRWMNQDLGPKPSRDLASQVKYLVIAGDLVDGIGIYPEQLDELTISNQKAQYEEAARLLDKLPEHIETIILPGNHDAVRRSLPQPVIPESYAPSLHANPRIHMVPNPISLTLNGVKVFVEHGTALTDILGSTPGHDFHHPITAVELLVRCRHVAPTYGQSTPIAPEKVDRLVIKDVPDVVLMGHIHIHEVKRYKGITLISCGSFQDQTPFQKRMNLEPTPGVISVFNLKTHNEIPLDLERLN